MNFLLSTECACDMPQELINKYNLQIAPMLFYINGQEFRSDDKNFSSEQVCKFMREGASTKTTQINENDAKEYLEELLKQGKDILHFSFSSAMSNTYNNFKKVAEELNATNENKIYVIDTLCQSGGVGLLIKLTADEIISKDLSITDAINFVESIKLNIAHIFTVDDLKYLKRGGRISTSSAVLGTILKIKPILRLSKEGVIVPAQKVISRKKAIATLAEKTAEYYSNKFDTIFITHADCEDEAKVLADMVKEKLGVTPYIMSLSALVTNHSGPGTMAIYFHAKSREFE